MEHELLQKLLDKSMTKKEFSEKIKLDFDLIPMVLEGVSSSKAAIRYSCSKALLDLSDEYPEKLYPHMDFFIELLDSKYRILIWNALAIIANLSKVDVNMKFDSIFNKYFSFINDEYMVTVANVVGHAGKIALVKPHLVEKITNELLKVAKISTTPHLTEECKKVIAESALKSFNMFFDKIQQKEKVLSFARTNLNSSRKTLRKTAQEFLNKWN
jgi:hypothetical protein